ncbi:MAG: hypothetical protein JW808_08600 [Victivallales bacterium]|nr:hypothetical protein [Victivallales bacterium]
MTWRSITLGFAGAAILCSVTYFNDQVLQQTHFIGNLLPLSIFGFLIIFLLIFNPLLSLLSMKAPLSGRELAVIIAIALSVSVIPGSGLMRTMTNMLILPHHFEQVSVGWQRQEILKSIPENMLASPGENRQALNNFMQGMGKPNQAISFADIPWDAWIPTLWFWVPLILIVYIGYLGLALAVHRQWSKHEQLPYPLVKFASALLPENRTRNMGEVFRNRIFWMGCGLVLVIHLNNYARVWFPEMILIPTVFDFTSLATAFGIEGVWGPYNFRMYFSVIAISYFLASDVGLSLGLSPMLYPLVRTFFAKQGISLSGGGQQAPERFVLAGGFMGMFGAIIYTGRYYYWNTLKKVFGTPGSVEVSKDSVWGMRVFMLSMLAFVFWLSRVGLDWQVGMLLALLFTIFYLVMARVVAETGLLFFQPFWMPSAVLVGLLGTRAVGTETTMIVFMVSVFFLVDPREAFMPFASNALKLIDQHRVKLVPGTSWLAAAICMGLFVGITMTLYFQYDKGAMRDSWGSDLVPKFAFDETIKVKQRLQAQGIAEEAAGLSGWQRMAYISPDKTSMASFVVGLVLVLVFTFGRLRFAKWPLHPVFFLVFFSYSGYMFAFSFLFGWAIKALVTKYGGEKAYHWFKPFMFGMIAGDMLGGFIPIVVGWIYYWVTGDLPKPFFILPG